MRRIGSIARQSCLDGDGGANDGVCDHANVVLDDNGAIKEGIPAAVPVTFEGEGGIVARADAITGSGCLGRNDIPFLQKLADDASNDKVALLVRLGDTETFAVRHRADRSVPGDWAHVQTTGVARTGGPSREATLRRITENPEIQCKVTIAYLFAM